MGAPARYLYLFVGSSDEAEQQLGISMAHLSDPYPTSALAHRTGTDAQPPKRTQR